MCVRLCLCMCKCVFLGVSVYVCASESVCNGFAGMCKCACVSV